MTNLCFYVSSVTTAMRGKTVLEKNGLRAYVTRSTDETVRNGCGYCVIATTGTDQAERLLRAAGIRIRAVKPIEAPR